MYLFGLFLQCDWMIPYNIIRLARLASPKRQQTLRSQLCVSLFSVRWFPLCFELLGAFLICNVFVSTSWWIFTKCCACVVQLVKMFLHLHRFWSRSAFLLMGMFWVVVAPPYYPAILSSVKYTAHNQRISQMTTQMRQRKVLVIIYIINFSKIFKKRK